MLLKIHWQSIKWWSLKHLPFLVTIFEVKGQCVINLRVLSHYMTPPCMESGIQLLSVCSLINREERSISWEERKQYAFLFFEPQSVNGSTAHDSFYQGKCTFFEFIELTIVLFFSLHSTVWTTCLLTYCLCVTSLLSAMKGYKEKANLRWGYCK